MTVTRGRAAKAVTLSEVAAEAGVSPATASFVLSGRDGRASAGSAETKRKVRQAAERLGYMPNRYARAMRTGRSDAIILALGTAGDPWGISLTRAVRERALERGLSTVVLADESWFDFLGGYASDVAFVTGADASPEGVEHLRRLARGGVEIVAFGTGIEPDGFDVVRSTADAAVRDAYAMLRERHEVVSFLGSVPVDPEHPPYRRPRALVFREAALAAGDVASAGALHTADRDRGRALAMCTAWLAEPDRPTAVVCSTGYLALTLQIAALRAGVAVPEELEIVSIGDVPDEAHLLGRVSYFGVDDVFARIADIIMERATQPGGDGPGVVHEFTWRYFPGETTREAQEDAEGASGTA